MKKILGIYTPPHQHWVGDGFPVRSLFSYQSQAKQLSPFLLLDFAGPAYFEPGTHRRGVGQHPHRGFETVTLVYEGEVAHRDSTGKGGVIGPGDVQWMTAAGGILHEEFHSEDFTRKGGTMRMVQLWVNLPAKDKLNPPSYQALVDADIPRRALPDDAGTLRVIAGSYADAQGPARTHTPMQVWDMSLPQGASSTFSVPDGWNTALVVLSGAARINDSDPLREAQMAVLAPEGRQIKVEATEDALVLLLSGQPILEPVVGYGPFVMNSHEQIETAIKDYQSGRFGALA